MTRHTVPFYANTPDDMHCFQAVVRSILKYFFPDKEYTWQQLEEMTGMKEGFWTWPGQMLLAFQKFGFEVVVIQGFDIEEFVKTGEEYLFKHYGKEVAGEQIKYGDIPQERSRYKEYLKYGKYEKRAPQIVDIKKLIQKGYLIICNVNAYALDGEEGYVGHIVLITGYDDKHLYLHDPGLPPIRDRKVADKQFMKAWEYPNKEARNLIGLKFNSDKRS